MATAPARMKRKRNCDPLGPRLKELRYAAPSSKQHMLNGSKARQDPQDVREARKDKAKRAAAASWSGR
jgi:hypothetical protein